MISDIIKGADLLIWPLALCSMIAVYIVCERLYALRKGAVLPDDLVDAIVEGRDVTPGESLLVPVNGLHGEGRQTHRDILRAPGLRAAVANPLTR